VNSPPPKPEVILTNFFAEPTVLLVPITSRELPKEKKKTKGQTTIYKTLHRKLKIEQHDPT
jgi:hypothetical protein